MIIAINDDGFSDCWHALGCRVSGIARYLKQGQTRFNRQPGPLDPCVVAQVGLHAVRVGRRDP